MNQRTQVCQIPHTILSYGWTPFIQDRRELSRTARHAREPTALGRFASGGEPAAAGVGAHGEAHGVCDKAKTEVNAKH